MVELHDCKQLLPELLGLSFDLQGHSNCLGQGMNAHHKCSAHRGKVSDAAEWLRGRPRAPARQAGQTNTARKEGNRKEERSTRLLPPAGA